ncbi:MAG: PD40 domain-containing protein [Flavobacteriales bacterium]|nr:PD40 domain-containing protein [Flavobacteriales bacterium]MBP6698908.1 PD40 domain-containing protein [Flavobacteriales bacterium]
MGRLRHMLVLLTALVAMPRGYAQGGAQAHVRTADQYFQQMAFALAVDEYRKAADLGAVNEHVTKRLAESYMKLGNTEEAERWYAIVVKFLNREPRDLYNYAQALKGNAKYDQAEEWMDKYLATRPPEGGPQRSNISSFARKFNDQQDRFHVKPLGINTHWSDFGAAWCGTDKVIFSSSRNEHVGIQRRAAWNDQPFLDLYVAQRGADGGLDGTVPLEGQVNSKLHEGPSACTPDGSSLYFTRNSAVKGRNGITRLGIYRARRNGTDWGGVEPFLYNNNECSMAHPAFSPDGKRMFFVSDMPGGSGGTDIYVCKDLGGQWGEPENLGPTVNTPHNEVTPSMGADGTLYFSSDGHPGLGGLDVFAATPAGSDRFTAAINVGAPVNSPKDDLGFIIDARGKQGYFSSNRPGGRGDDDIYAFTMNYPLEQRYLCTGVVIDDEVSAPLIDVTVELQDMKGGLLATTTTDVKGEYSFAVQKDKEYRVVARMKGRYDGEQHLSTETIENQQIVARDIHLVPDAGVWLRGAVRYKDRLGFIPDMTVSVVNLTSFNSESATTGEGGDFSFRMQANEEFEVLFEKPGYYSMSVPVSTVGIRQGVIDLNQARDLSFEPVEVGKPVRLKFVKWSDAKSTALEPNAKTELDGLAERLKVNPALVVEIAVHSDSQGDAEEQMKLTQKRAQVTIDLLISKGIPKDRVVAKGYGGTRLLNHCVPGVQCSEQEHAENRRVEYTVLEVRQ